MRDGRERAQEGWVGSKGMGGWMRGQERTGTIGGDKKTDNGEGWKGMGERT